MSCKALISPSLLALYSKLRRGECLTHIGTEGLLQLQKDLADPRLKVNFDPSHIQVHGDDPVRAVRELGSAIVHVYIKDAAGSPGKFVFPPLGMGCVDFEGIFRALVDIGYGGFISIEYEANAFGYPGEPRTVAMESRRFVCDILRQIHAAPQRS